MFRKWRGPVWGEGADDEEGARGRSKTCLSGYTTWLMVLCAPKGAVWMDSRRPVMGSGRDRVVYGPSFPGVSKGMGLRPRIVALLMSQQHASRSSSTTAPISISTRGYGGMSLRRNDTWTTDGRRSEKQREEARWLFDAGAKVVEFAVSSR